MRHFFFHAIRPAIRYCAGALIVFGCVGGLHAEALIKTHGPVKAQIIQTNGGYQLLVDGKPFYIKGAGMETGDQTKLAQHGGNSLRTWSSDNVRLSGGQILDRAQTNGLYVTLGLRVGLERLGFNYNDPVAIAAQKEHIRKEVLKYKDHPALIIWSIGNELNLDGKNPAVWNAVNELSKMIHELDPNHLTTTPLAGFKGEVVKEIQNRAPDLDLLSFQMYGDIVNLPRYLHETAYQGPYLITEWGATGHWEVPKTDWGAPIENDSTTKAELYRRRYEKVILADRKQCLGSYVFLWGHKQERTPTWYGMFLDSGEETATVDAMEYLWTGKWPAVQSPKLEGAWLDGRTAYQNIHLKPGRDYQALVRVANQADNTSTFNWDVLEESTELKTGGDFEKRPGLVPDSIQNPHLRQITLKAPSKSGSYRLFAYVFDGKGHAAHANIPFYVDAVPTTSLVDTHLGSDDK